VAIETTAAPGIPVLRWSSRARTIPDIEAELGRIWSSTNLTVPGPEGEERHVAARTSVLNLVVVATRPEIGEHAAAIVSQLAGRHPSRTLIVSSADPDGPSWLDARIQAHCMLPRADAAETCAELIYLAAGGESGRHLQAIVAPLLVHDLPVTLWWPGDPPLGGRAMRELAALADVLIVDGSSWSGDGLDRLARLADLVDDPRLEIVDFGLLRQSRWREAIASAFDLPELQPFVRSIRSMSVTYGSHAGGTANVVKPVYHVSWLASRLGLTVREPLVPESGGGYRATLRSGTRVVPAALRPVESTLPAGTTLAVELVAERRGGGLRVEVTADGEAVVVRATPDGERPIERRFAAARRTEVELLAEAIETVGSDRVARGALRAAAELAGAGSAVG